MRRLAQEDGFKLALAMDGVSRCHLLRQDAGRAPRLQSSTAWRPKVAAELEIPFLDWHATFAAHDAGSQQRVEFAHDGHWNELANPLVGAEIARFLLREGDPSGGRLARGAGARQPQG